MKPQRPILCRFAAMSILVVMAGTFAGPNSATVSAQSAEEFSVYRLNDKSPSEARRMLNELLGDEAEDARIVADDDAAELLVSGSPAVQKLAAKLVEQLNSSETIKPLTDHPTVAQSPESDHTHRLHIGVDPEPCPMNDYATPSQLTCRPEPVREH